MLAESIYIFSTYNKRGLIYMITKIDKIKEIMEKELSCSAHKLDHVMRVHNMCIYEALTIY